MTSKLPQKRPFLPLLPPKSHEIMRSIALTASFIPYTLPRHDQEKVPFLRAHPRYQHIRQQHLQSGRFGHLLPRVQCGEAADLEGGEPKEGEAVAAAAP
jgi:hypothetical protein